MLQAIQGNSAQPRPILSYPKSVRIDQIQRAIAIEQAIQKRGLSMRQIASRIQMSPSGHLMSLLWDMNDDGLLIAKPHDYRDNMKRWEFRIPPDRLGVLLDEVYGESAPVKPSK